MLERIFQKITLLLSAFLLLTISSDAGSKNIDSSKISFERQYKKQLNNFVFLTRYVTLPEETIAHSTASGMIISSTKSHIFALTAHHFCEEEQIGPLKTEIVMHNSSNARIAQVLFTDKDNDICLLAGVKYKDESFKNIKLANKMPAIGERSFNVAAPNGMGSPKTRLLFDGYFGGCEEICVFTIPATFGSSGSAVFNEKGELISIIVMATPDFENVAIGPDIYTIEKFLSRIEELMEIK